MRWSYMALADAIQTLCEQVLTDLREAHDYYEATKIAWSTVEGAVEKGEHFTFHNAVTGSVYSETEIVSKVNGYVSRQLAEATFVSFLSIFENFIFEFLRLWLTAYPQILSSKKLDYKIVLEAADIEAITLHVVNKELNEILYERPAGWFAYLEEKAKLGYPTSDEIERISEAKACRDALAHNRGVASKTYLSKAGKLAQFVDGERVEIIEPYHRAIWDLLCQVVAKISNAAIAKVS